MLRLQIKNRYLFKQLEWNNKEQCPLTVREGRNWIDSIHNEQWIQNEKNYSKHKRIF